MAMTEAASLDNGHLDGYLAAMTEYTVAEARDNLPKLLNQALAGEEVIITRRGKPLVTLVPKRQKTVALDGPKSAHDVEWLDRHRISTDDPNFDAAAFIRAMRDESY
jgi:prevent-host-death family protein